MNEQQGPHQDQNALAPRLPGPRPSLAIGPANYAGQATAWASAARRDLNIPAWSFSRTANFNFSSDRQLPAMSGMSELRRHILHPATQTALQGSTHVYLDGFLALSGGRWTENLEHDIRDLKDLGKELALICHGSDVRDPIAHMRRVPHSWWKSAGPRYFLQTLKLSRKNQNIIQRSGLPVFVSTPDLLHDVPNAVWLPLTLDAGAWECDEPALSGNRRPRVLHLPTRKKPAIKGTSTISAVLRQLEHEGLVERLEPNKMSHSDFRKTLKSVDIVIDQICCDSYGATSVESMAAGRLAISSVLQTRDLVGVDIPILDATPNTLEPVLRQILKDPESFRDVAAQGPAYVRQMHDGRGASQALLQAIFARNA